MGAEHAGGEGDETVPRLVGRHSAVRTRSRHLGGLGVGHPESYHRRARGEPPLQQRQHPRHHLLPAPHPVHRDDPSVGIEGQDRLHVQHAGEPRLAAGDPAGPEQVVVPVHREQHPGPPPHPLQLPRDLPSRSSPTPPARRPRSASIPTPERRGPAVHQVDAADPAGAHRGLGRGEGARQVRPDSRTATTSSASARASRNTRTNSAGRRLGRGGQVPGLAEPAVELLRLELHPVAEGLVAEHHLQRDQRDVMPVEHRVGQVGGAVGHDGDRRGAPGAPAAGAGPACRPPWWSPPVPTGLHS